MFVILLLLFFSTKLVAYEKPLLSDYKKNVYSQFGEDGIIEKIFEVMGTTSKVAIEFGAHDGFSCSNTANLWTNDSQWIGILIEADRGLYEQMVANTVSYRCIGLHRTVGIGPDDSLEAILAQGNISDQIDLLSIDIDGDDYYIFDSLQHLRPRLIICEYNPSIPAHFDIHTIYGGHVGCSVAALQRIAAQKGYALIAITDTNCFFVRDEELYKFAEYDTDREHMRIDRYILYVISDYQSCYQMIATPDFRDPWGWGGKPSTELFNIGNGIIIPAQISR